MCPVFFVRIFGMGVERGGSDAVGGFGCGSRQNSAGTPVFCLLWSPREPDLESVVEHFFNFWKICSTLEPARGGFGVGGRTFFQFLEILFYFRSRAGRIWSRR